MQLADKMVTVLTAPAGAGKTRTMAEFARAWDALIGGRIIGITTAENAAQVMADGEEVRWTPGPRARTMAATLPSSAN